MIITVLVIICFSKYKFIAFFLLGGINSLFTGYHYNYGLSSQEIQAYTFFSKTHTIEAKVTSLTTHSNSSPKVNVLVSKLDGKTIKQYFTLRLNWRKGQVALPKHEESWRLKVKFKPAHGFANPGSFNFQVWLREKSIHATGYIKEAEYLSGSPSLRQALYDKTVSTLNILKRDAGFSDSSIATFLALTFGDRSQLSKDDWNTYKLTGTQHLIAISGLHLALVFGFALAAMKVMIKLCNFVLKLLGTYSIWFENLRHGLTCYNAHKLCLLLALICAAFYAYLAGFSAPTMRALVMLGVYVLSVCIALHLSKTRLLLLTMTLIFIIEPMSPLMLGFWLSVVAVAIIFVAIYVANLQSIKLSHWKTNLASLVLIQLALSFFMAPLLIWQNSEISVISGVVNLLAVPWVSLITLPLTLLAFFGELIEDYFAVSLASNYVSILALYSIELFYSGLQIFIANSENVTNSLKQISRQSLANAVALLSLFLSFCYLFFWHKNSGISNKIKMFGTTQVVLSFVLIYVSLSVYQEVYAAYDSDKKQWQVNVLDVGQGLAIVIEKDEQVAIYDFGASYPSGFNISAAVIYPYLKSKGINSVDLAIISHSDNDHYGGFEWLEKRVTINKLVVPQEDTKIKWQAHFSEDQVMNCSDSKTLRWQGLNFQFLNTELASKSSVNDKSCVIRVSDGVNSVLLTGDISKVVERRLVANHNLKSDILIAPHHGSKSSSSSSFLAATSPSVAIFSAGFMNRWNMPSEEVLFRYKEQGIKTYETAISGMVSVRFNGVDTDVVQYRQNILPFWFANPSLTIGD